MAFTSHEKLDLEIEATNCGNEQISLVQKPRERTLDCWYPRLRAPFSPASRIITFIFTAGFLPTAKAAFSLEKCCVKAVRQEFSKFSDYPWNICMYKDDIDFSSDKRLESVVRTLGWCKEHCRGTQTSELRQWLQPLATYISPYVGILLLCPIGDLHSRQLWKNREGSPLARTEKVFSWLWTAWEFVRNPGQEYVNLLGDPASAIWGAFSEIKSDIETLWKLSHPRKENIWLKEVMWFITLAGDTKFKDGVTWRDKLTLEAISESISDAVNKVDEKNEYKERALEIIAGLENARDDIVLGDELRTHLIRLLRGYQTHISSLPACLDALNDFGPKDEVIKTSHVEITSSSSNEIESKETTVPEKTVSSVVAVETSGDSVRDIKLSPPSERPTGALTKTLAQAIRIVVLARIHFLNSVLLPIMLMLAVTASSFYDAYSKLGDNDTAHALAYCVWYSWLLILGVSGNCFASTINTELAINTLGKFVGISKRKVALRHRYMNAHEWDLWLESMGRSEELDKVKPKSSTYHWAFWAKYAGGQTLGWVCVAVPTACAAAISYQTPTVGIGCRSFNFLLYGILSLVVAWVHVLKQWLRARYSVKDRAEVGVTETAVLPRDVPGLLRKHKWQISDLSVFVFGFYWFLVTVNCLVMVGGTAFHLAGVFRSCACKRLFVGEDTPVELNKYTQLAVDNAKRYWLSTGYVAFSFAWLICLIAIAFRRYITMQMTSLVESWEDLDD